MTERNTWLWADYLNFLSLFPQLLKDKNTYLKSHCEAEVKAAL